MKNIIKHLWLAVSLILATSFILLMSDREQRAGHVKESKSMYPSIAVMQIASTGVLDSHVAGVVDRLGEMGYRAPDGKNIRIYNPQGDYATANAMAKDIANSPYDIVITSSTVALQTFAKANKSTKKTHVFGAVTDPFGTGIGITGPEPDQHPPYIAGAGTFQPVEQSIRIAYEMNPGLKRLGVVWNPGEQCSEACLKKARATCKTLGVELVEANAANTSEVSEAARSLFAKSVDAVWIGGDSVAIASAGLIVNLAGQAGIPVFTNDPTDAKKGALFGLGADYYTVGQYTADIAVAIFEGKKPSSFRIENVIPEKLGFNHDVLATLKGTWKKSPSVEELLARQEKQQPERPLAPEPGKTYRVGLSYFVPAPIFDIAIDGFKNELADLGFIEGNNLELITCQANGDMSFLPQATANLVRQHPDILVALSTPCLSSAIAHSEGINITFGVVSAPLAAGAGNSFDDHLPHVTGIVYQLPTEEVFEWTKKLFPRAKRIGTLYNPSEANSEKEALDLKRILDQQGIALVKMPVYSASEITESIRSVLSKDVDLFFAMGVNVVANGMPAIIKACRQHGVPVIADDISLMGTGALISCAPGPYSDGQDLAKVTARVLLGESPANIPIVPGKNKELAFDLLAAKKAGITPPPKLLERTDVFFNRKDKNQVPAKPFKLRMVLYNEAEFAERCKNGLIDGIRQAGFKEGRDYELKIYNAQGDMSTLSSIMSTVKSDQADLLMVISTPVLQAALRQAGEETKIVFTGVADGVKAGAGKNETDHLSNVTGVSIRSPFDGMAKMIRKTLPEAQRVGTLFTPGEINSVLYRDLFKEELGKVGLELIAIPVVSMADVSQSAIALCKEDIHVVAQVVDNLTSPGFALIARKAYENDLPVYVFESSQMNEGGTLCLARDSYDAGLEAAEKAVRVLRGENPKDISFNNTVSEKLILNPELAKRYNLRIPETMQKQAKIYTSKK